MEFLKIKEIIKKYEQTIPVDVEALAKELGMRVKFIPLPDSKFSGAIHSKDTRTDLYVNREHLPTRQRFTIAHEVAHFVLHSPYLKDGIVDDDLYRSHLPSALESQANNYALQILIPSEILNQKVDSGMEDIEELAREFNVSANTMSSRLGFPYERMPRLGDVFEPRVIPESSDFSEFDIEPEREKV